MLGFYQILEQDSIYRYIRMKNELSAWFENMTFIFRIIIFEICVLIREYCFSNEKELKIIHSKNNKGWREVLKYFETEFNSWTELMQIA